MTEEVEKKIDEWKVVTFYLEDELFCIPISYVKMIRKVGEIAKIPRTPEFIEGVTEYMDRIIPIINLKKHLSIPESTKKEEFYIVLEMQDADGNDHIFGILIDQIQEVTDVDPSTVQPPTMLGNYNLEYIKGVTRIKNKITIIIDPEKLLSAQELELMQQAASLGESHASDEKESEEESIEEIVQE